MSDVVAKMDWRELYAFAKKQAIVGFCFEEALEDWFEDNDRKGLL